MRDELRERTVNPYTLLFDRGQWYVVGLDLDDDKVKTFRVSRIRGDIRLATRRERDFRLPERFDADEYRLGPPWQVGETPGEARIEVGGDTAWWIDRLYGRYGQIEDGVFVTPYSNLGRLSAWILRQDGRAVPLAPPELRRLVRDDLDLVQKRHNGKVPRVAAETRGGGGRGRELGPRARRCHRSASDCSRRCSRTCSPAAARRRESSSRPPTSRSASTSLWNRSRSTSSS